MSDLITRANDMASQENCDGEEYDMIVELADHIEQLKADLELSKTMCISLCTEISYWKNKYADMKDKFPCSRCHLQPPEDET